MSTLRLVGSAPDRITRRLVARWPDPVVRDRARAGPCDAILLWDEQSEQLAGVLDGQRGYRSGRPWWLHTRAAGVDPALLSALAEHDVVFTKGSGAHAVAVAEHVLAVLLALCKRLPALVASAGARRWLVPDGIRELRDSAVTVLGFGAIGSATAQLLTGVGATVLGVCRTPRRGAHGVELLPVARLTDALRRSSVLIIAAPLTAATRGMIGAAQLSAMPAGSLLVNVGRGPIVREAALVAALASGQLAGAALDVLDVEPLPPRSRLWDVPNLLITPHCADATPATEDRALDTFLANADRWRRDETLHGLVDLAHGY